MPFFPLEDHLEGHSSNKSGFCNMDNDIRQISNSGQFEAQLICTFSWVYPQWEIRKQIGIWLVAFGSDITFACSKCIYPRRIAHSQEAPFDD